MLKGNLNNKSSACYSVNPLVFNNLDKANEVKLVYI